MKTHWWPLIPLLLLMVFLGARGLNADSIWGDEYYSLYDAGGSTFGPLSPSEIWQRVAGRNPWHTPGYFVVLSFWGRLLGWSVFSARSLSLFIGVLAVAWTYRLGREMVSAWVGLVSAAVLGSSAFFIHFLHEIRMYTLFVLLAAFTTWIYLRIVTRDGRVQPVLWVGLFGGALMMLYTHYFATLPLGALGLYHLWLAYRRKLSWSRWLGVVGVLGLAGLLFLPWFSQLLAVLQQSTDSEGRNRSDNVSDTFELIGQGLTKFSNGYLIVFGVAAVLALAAVFTKNQRIRRAWFFALAMLFVFFGVNVIVDITHTGRLRYMITAFPFLAIITGIGIVYLSRFTRWLAPLALVLWIVTGVWSNATGLAIDEMDGTLQFYPMHRTAAGLREFGQPGDTVVHYLPDVQPAWYYGGVVDYYFAPLGMDFRILEKKRRDSWQEEQTADNLATLDAAQRIWVASMTTMPTTTLTDFEAALMQDFQQCTTIDYESTLRFDLFARDAVCCWSENSAEPPLMQFGADVQLAGMNPLPEIVADELPLLLGWVLSPDTSPNTYSVALHIEDMADNLVAQADYGLPYQRFDCHPSALDVSQLAPGNYHLLATVYRWEDGSRLLGTNLETGETGDRLYLGEFSISRP